MRTGVACRAPRCSLPFKTKAHAPAAHCGAVRGRYSLFAALRVVAHPPRRPHLEEPLPCFSPPRYSRLPDLVHAMLTRRGLLAALPSCPWRASPRRTCPRHILMTPAISAPSSRGTPGSPKRLSSGPAQRPLVKSAIAPPSCVSPFAMPCFRTPPSGPIAGPDRVSALPALSGRAFTPLLRTGAEEQAHFADAAHLMRYNFRRLSADLNAAQPGDALFWCQQPASARPTSWSSSAPAASNPRPAPSSSITPAPMGNGPANSAVPRSTIS